MVLAWIVDDAVDVGGVAAAHRDDDRQARVRQREHEWSREPQAVDRQLETSEAVAFVRISAGEIEDDLGTTARSITREDCC